MPLEISTASAKPLPVIMFSLMLMSSIAHYPYEASYCLSMHFHQIADVIPNN